MDGAPMGCQAKILAKACQRCRSRKIKCDTKRPTCGACASQHRQCVYNLQPPKARPTKAVLRALQCEERRLRQLILRLKASSPAEVSQILDTINFADNTDINCDPASPNSVGQRSDPRSEDDHATIEQDDVASQVAVAGDKVVAGEEQNLDTSPFYSINEMGHLDSFGPSSALQSSAQPPVHTEPITDQHIRNSLISNAVLERQREHELRSLSDIDGVDVDLALHLLDLHWSRQHHTLLLTYRPAIMRDLREGGPHCSAFLINAIFAGASKYSRRNEVRDDFKDPKTAGRRFFRRCDELLSKDSLLAVPSIPTVIGLLLLGSTFISLGETSKGWLYSGYALRMIYDLGLHLDLKPTLKNAEEVEIRRRVFWGAFISDKLQSLYLGRPTAIHLRDAHVTRHFMDTIEEKEIWKPYKDPTLPDVMGGDTVNISPPFILSVSTFQQLCSLSQIMTRIIDEFYVVGATAANARANLQTIDDLLNAWKRGLPEDLEYDPAVVLEPNARKPPPNLLHLHCLYHALIILVHRPLLSDGHLRTAAAPASSWRRCSEAARNITNIALAYQVSHSFRGGPYILAYAIYVACTIHVRNAVALEINQAGENCSMLTASLRCLDDLTIPNPGVIRPAGIIRNLVATSGLSLMIDVDGDPPQDNWDINVNEILRMFPSRSLVSQDYSQMRRMCYSSGFEHALNEDVLYGFMDAQSTTLPCDFVPSIFSMESL
ncbi:fungal-specific transcription factor domain-containing protein [Xylogone sp. PMI_703]|nr:fungal-specific transcription factor domain-containing protein [Xylogone sp. PMI_703]